MSCNDFPAQSMFIHQNFTSNLSRHILQTENESENQKFKKKKKEYIRGSPVVYWSRRLITEWKDGGLNPVLGEMLLSYSYLNDQEPTTPSKSCGSSTPHVPLSVRIRTGETLGLGKASLIGAHHHRQKNSEN